MQDLCHTHIRFNQAPEQMVRLTADARASVIELDSSLYSGGVAISFGKDCRVAALTALRDALSEHIAALTTNTIHIVGPPIIIDPK